MLKFVFFSLLMGFSAQSWAVVQSLLAMASFFFGLFYVSDFFLSHVGLGLGVDSVGYILILLSFWIITLVVLSSNKILETKEHSSLFLLVNIALLVSLILAFSSQDYLLFYICFETSLIPTLILILGWGYQPERLQAGIYMLFYTLFGSLPLLVSLISLYKVGGTLVFGLVPLVSAGGVVPFIWYICSIFAFLVKLPMFMVHLWLPKAHVEAPVAGSMILAGVLLKLGGYGLMRVCPIFVAISMSWSWVWITLGVVGGTIVSMMCLRQADIKALIAYSSVAHMGMVLCGFMLFSWWGLKGAVAVMVGHGLCSSGLFCLANMVYERLGSRSLMISKGLVNFMPSMTLWWFLLSIGNMAAPPTINLLGEINLVMSIVSWCKLSALPLAILCFFSAAYTLFMFSMSQHGKVFSSLFSCCSGQVREYLALMLHWLPLNVMILKGSTLIVPC
uniref:NADH-ubiquinone oxidoreductase chain 4 n=1 Tax=Caridina gracilipes TaxID=859806 RepID=A0A0U1X532_9EUCA|nr:NADH dehydrogenase subunit 4 [Caridina gracilipes]AIJ50614.1 NADH dehydrogenase subunit 4 [Caridina gracilipes]